MATATADGRWTEDEGLTDGVAADPAKDLLTGTKVSSTQYIPHISKILLLEVGSPKNVEHRANEVPQLSQKSPLHTRPTKAVGRNPLEPNELPENDRKIRVTSFVSYLIKSLSTCRCSVLLCPRSHYEQPKMSLFCSGNRSQALSKPTSSSICPTWLGFCTFYTSSFSCCSAVLIARIFLGFSWYQLSEFDRSANRLSQIVVPSGVLFH